MCVAAIAHSWMPCVGRGAVRRGRRFDWTGPGMAGSTTTVEGEDFVESDDIYWDSVGPSRRLDRR